MIGYYQKIFERLHQNEAKVLHFFLACIGIICVDSLQSSNPAEKSSVSSSSTAVSDTSSSSTSKDSAQAAPEQIRRGEAVKAEALKYAGVPYLWGGKTPEGFDSSGLVQYVYKKAANIDLGSTVASQARHTVAVPIEDAVPGDLLFWDGYSHVGIYLGNNEFIHAPGTDEKVKSEDFSEMPLDGKVAERVVE